MLKRDENATAEPAMKAEESVRTIPLFLSFGCDWFEPARF